MQVLIDENGQKYYEFSNNYVLRHDSQRENCYWFVRNGHACTSLIFYYSPEETKEIHLHNLKLVRENKSNFLYQQIIGIDWINLPKKTYTEIVNAYIKGNI